MFTEELLSFDEFKLQFKKLFRLSKSRFFAEILT